jgi:hypothetical protein
MSPGICEVKPWWISASYSRRYFRPIQPTRRAIDARRHSTLRTRAPPNDWTFGLQSAEAPLIRTKSRDLRPRRERCTRAESRATATRSLVTPGQDRDSLVNHNREGSRGPRGQKEASVMPPVQYRTLNLNVVVGLGDSRNSLRLSE